MKQEEYNYKLKDVLHALNVLGEDRDMSADGYDVVAVCPPLMITPDGEEYFKDVLNSKMYDSSCSSDTEEIDEKVNELLWSLAGYCASSKFEKWFEGPTAKLI